MSASPPSPHQQRWTIYLCPECAHVQTGDGRCRNAFTHRMDERVMVEPVEVVPAEVAERLAEALRVAHKHIANDHLVLAVRTLDKALSDHDSLSSPADSQEEKC